MKHESVENVYIASKILAENIDFPRLRRKNCSQHFDNRGALESSLTGSAITWITLDGKTTHNTV